MATPTPDQQRIIDTLDRPLFVAAGAGSGKSTTLAERVAWAMQPGSAPDGGAYLASLDEALIITFTHAAADEIREKVRSKLREAGMEAQALTVDAAWISTIHGMCARILRRHALDLGIDPDFQMVAGNVQDQLERLARDRVAREIREEVAPDGQRAYAALYDEYAEKSDDAIFDMASKLRAQAAAAINGFDSISFPGTDDLDYSLRHYHEMLAGHMEAHPEAFESKTGAAQKVGFSADLERLDALLAQAPSARPACDLATLAKTLTVPALNYGGAEFKEMSRELRAERLDLVGEIEMARLAPLAGDLLEIAQRTDRVYRDFKRAEGVLDNDDLLSLTLSAFRDHPEIAEEYAHRFKLVMIDEFQDTNAQQVKMVELLSGEDACHLCTVGDAQQSIYRFRAADVQVFRDREAEVPEASVVHLAQNFRSHSDILAFVEHTLGQGVLRDYMHLDPFEARPSSYTYNLPRIDVEVVYGGSSDTRSALESRMIADRLAALCDEGAEARDMALLLRSMSNVETYLEALRARGLECVVSGGSSFSDSPEVRIVAALAHVLANPADTELGLFPVLTSEMFCVDADDLCILSTGKNDVRDSLRKRGIDRGLRSFDFVAGAAPSERLLRARDVLDRALTRLATWPTNEVLLAAIRESGWAARLELQGPAGMATLANVLAATRFFGEIADEGHLGVARSAFEFDHWLDVVKEGPASLVGGDSGAVRVMTVHASKGLEFPIVALAECWGDHGASATGLVTSNLSGEVKASLMPAQRLDSVVEGEPPASEESSKSRLDWARLLYAHETQGEHEEAARLLYVGLTRAREALIVGLSVRTSSKGAIWGAPNLVSGVVDTLFAGNLPEVGTSSLAYGGSEPADVRCIGIEPAGKGEPATMDTGGIFPELDGASVDVLPEALSKLDASYGISAHNERFTLFDVDVVDGLTEARLLARPWAGREGVFSYSSAHAERRAAEGERDWHHRELRHEDDWSGGVDTEFEPDLNDGDRATSLGSAFHLLAQAMLESGSFPSDERIEATCEQCHLKPARRARVAEALARWHSSAIRAEALSHTTLLAEVPFFAQATGSKFGQHLEGTIDLLASDPGSATALVIDYKTGDRNLSLAEIHERHEMQANFYAWALMERGYEFVECAFVCVEREEEGGQPLVVRYAFTPDSPPVLV